ncbi:helix-turn-helix transcriptional regulator [Xanthobacter aminoxidans]|uniref:helix-turn-helix transcriptional regulator n=1 Tax=Xanthobacter aminoxidans TaxID=186280 RepID=UPI00372A915E
MAFVREFYGPILTGLDLVPDPDDPFRMAASFLDLPGVTVRQVHASALVSTRTAELLSDGIDDLTICRAERAYRVATPDGRAIEVHRGETGVWNLGQRSSAFTQSDTRFRIVQVSRALLRALVPNLDDLDMLRFAPGDAALDLMFGYADLVERQSIGSQEDGRVIAGQLAELAALVLRREAGLRDAAGRNSIRAARLAAAKAATHAALHRPDLSATTIGTQLGISARYVQVLFEEGGETFSAHVTRLRMEWLRRMLDDPRHAHRRISDLAFEAGFRDLSTFNRQFRRHFGEAPSAARRREVP